MSETLPEPGLSSTPPDRPAYRPFPELAKAIRAQTEQILREWHGRTVSSMPELGELSVKEFKDDIARILSAMADALESNDPPDLRRLVEAAPSHGFHRFMQNYDLADLFMEERILRRVIVAKVEDALGRQCKPDEAAALHAMIDIMLQQGVLALVQEQRQELQESTEVQLKYLSFLSHDLSNNFLVITGNLEHIQRQLAAQPNMQESAEVLAAAIGTIRRTRDGMRGLLEHERLRNSDAKPRIATVSLREIVEPLVKVAKTDAHGKGLRIEIEIAAEAKAHTNADLVSLILQNLIGNAVKHTSRESTAGASGLVRIEAERQNKQDQDFWVVSVVDDGPGIPQDKLDRLFSAFQQLPRPGGRVIGDEGGFGLGLAIAAEAARLLGTKIEVKTQPGQGSKFSFRVSAPRAG